MSIPTGLNLDQQLVEESDSRNFDLDVLGGMFGYTPKSTEKIVRTLSVKDQLGVNSCVCESTAVQKEVDERVELSASDIGAYLLSKGLINESGTSIQAALKATMERGIAEESVVITDHADFKTFSHPSRLTKEGADNAALHRSKTYWRTSTIDTMLQQADEGRVGQIGCLWHSGWNTLQAPYIIEKPIGRPIGGHDVNCIGYNLQYNGGKMLTIQTSYGKGYGDNGKFYVPFESFNSIFITGAYFVLDIDRDMASWLSLNASKAIKEKNGPKIYLIEGNQKRHVDSEATFLMLGLNFKEVIEDKEDMLSLVQEGLPLTILDIPPTEVERFKETLMIMKNSFQMVRIFKPIFPDLFV